MLNEEKSASPAGRSAVALRETRGAAGNKKLWIIVFLVVFVAISAGIFFYSTTTQPSVIGPSPAQSPTILPSPSASQSAAATKVKIFMIAQDDNGASGKLIGCGDSAVAVEREVPETQAVLRAAMEQLISIKDSTYGQSGLVNPLSQSSLNFVSAAIDNGKATVKFTGNLVLPGECGDARIKAQFEETALQFSTVQSVDILINDQNLRDLTSQQG